MFKILWLKLYKQSNPADGANASAEAGTTNEDGTVNADYTVEDDGEDKK